MIMNKMKIIVLSILSVFSSVSYAETACEKLGNYRNAEVNYPGQVESLETECAEEKKKSAENKPSSQGAETAPLPGGNGIPAGSPVTKCPAIMEAYDTAKATATANKQQPPVPNKGYNQCLQLLVLSQKNGFNDIEALQGKDTAKSSVDGMIRCVQQYSYTVDYEPCVKVLNYYNAVTNAEIAMDLQQKVRTDIKNKSILEKQNMKAQQGDLQGGSFDAAIESNEHMKAMNKEKLIAYGASVTALASVYKSIPGDKEVLKACEAGQGKYPPKEYGREKCKDTVKIYGGSILANQDAKAGLASAIMKFTAKAAAAGLLMRNNQTASNQIAASKKLYDEPGNEILTDRCAFNPNDPACVTKGSRVSQQGYKSGDFTVGDGTSSS